MLRIQSYLMTFAVVLIFLSSAACYCLPPQVQDNSDNPVEAIAHFMSERTELVAWIDMQQIQDDELATACRLMGPVVGVSTESNAFEAIQSVRASLAPFSIPRFYILADGDLFMGVSSAFIAVIPCEDPEQVVVALRQNIEMQKLPLVMSSNANEVLIVAEEKALKRWGRVEAGRPTAAMLEGLKSCRGAHGLVCAPSPGLLEMLPNMARIDYPAQEQLFEAVPQFSRLVLFHDLTSRLPVFQLVFRESEQAEMFAEAANEISKVELRLSEVPEMLVAQDAVVTIPETAMKGLISKILEHVGQSVQRVTTRNSLRQLILASHNFHDAYKSLPPQALANKEGQKLHSWRVMILPYLDQQELYDQFKLDEAWDSPHNIQLVEKMPAIFVSPDGKIPEQQKQGLTRYLGIVMHGSIMGRPGLPVSLGEIYDGTSNTVLFVEASPARAVIWTKPEDLSVDVENPLAGILEEGQTVWIAAMADGSTHMIPAAIRKDVVNALFNFNGGEMIERPLKLDQ